VRTGLFDGVGRVVNSAAIAAQQGSLACCLSLKVLDCPTGWVSVPTPTPGCLIQGSALRTGGTHGP
jgi:hypothetical protein